MKNENPAIHQGPPFRLVLFRLLRAAVSLPYFVVCCCLVVWCGLDTPASWAQGNTAVVTGAKRLMVRRGPTKGAASFATLSKGTKVEVQEMHGEWARIVTPGRQVGYVNSNFLALPSEKPKAAPTPTAASSTMAPTAPSVGSESAAVHTLTERNQSLENEVRGLRDELTTLKSRAGATPALAPPVAAPAADTEQLRSELKRLTTAVEGLQRRMDTSPTTEGALPMATVPADGISPVVSPLAILLGGVGLSIGWLVGSTYSRRQDRGRRSRVRF